MATAGEQATASGEDVADVGGIGSDTLAETSLDRLPPELLLHIFSWLDWHSLIALQYVSVRCRDAVALHLGRLQLFSVDGALWQEFRAEQRPGLPPPLTGPVKSQPSEAAHALAALLPKMVALREFRLIMSGSGEHQQDLLTAVVTASRHWPMLERLKLGWWDLDSRTPDPGLLRQLMRQLNANCERLTSVTLYGLFSDNLATTVVKSLSTLRTLRVSSALLRGSFLPHLPTDLHNLSLGARDLRWWPLTSLLRCHDLRSLEFSRGGLGPEPTQLVSVLVGCVHLERLSLEDLRKEFVACLPPDGLPTLRHLAMEYGVLNEEDIGGLVERLPRLESVSLGWCFSLTPGNLAPLGRLTALSSLRLGSSGTCVSDWLLTQLSTAPLVELQLPAKRLMNESTCTRLQSDKTLTVDGVLHLIRHCKSLRVLILSAEWGYKSEEQRIICGAGVQERDVEQAIRLFMDHMVFMDHSFLPGLAKGWHQNAGIN